MINFIIKFEIGAPFTRWGSRWGIVKVGWSMHQGPKCWDILKYLNNLGAESRPNNKGVWPTLLKLLTYIIKKICNSLNDGQKVKNWLWILSFKKWKTCDLRLFLLSDIPPLYTIFSYLVLIFVGLFDCFYVLVPWWNMAAT